MKASSLEGSPSHSTRTRLWCLLRKPREDTAFVSNSHPDNLATKTFCQCSDYLIMTCHDKSERNCHLQVMPCQLEACRCLSASLIDSSFLPSRFQELTSRLPSYVFADRACAAILDKLQSMGIIESRKITPQKFLNVLTGLKPWELCLPDVSAAVEVRGHSMKNITYITINLYKCFYSGLGVGGRGFP